VGDTDYATSSLAAFLPGEVHFPVNGRAGTYIDFDHTGAATDAQVIAVACRLLEATGAAPVIVMNRPLEGTPTRMLASFQGAAVTDENFWIYQLEGGGCAPRQREASGGSGAAPP
jgi:hypothetical protein